MIDVVLFVAFPYVAVVLAVLVGIYRYSKDRFSFSSFSSQFLERRVLLWGSVLWHYGVIVLLLIHVGMLFLLDVWAALNADPVRQSVIQFITLASAVATVVGLVLLSLRRLLNARIRAVTSAMDWVLLATLLAQVGLGFWLANFFPDKEAGMWDMRIGPWLLSLLQLNPQTESIASLPWLLKVHMLGGFLLIALFPFTRLVHIGTFPVTYLWRPYQVVIWNRRPLRQPGA